MEEVQPYLRSIRAERRPCLLIVSPEQNLTPAQARLCGGEHVSGSISSPPLMKLSTARRRCLSSAHIPGPILSKLARGYFSFPFLASRR